MECKSGFILLYSIFRVCGLSNRLLAGKRVRPLLLIVKGLHVKHCRFLQANITFLNNSAALRGSAICIDSLMMCAWDSSSRTLNFSQALRWKPTFHYEGNVLCTNPYHLQQCRKLLNDTSRHDISTFVSSLQERNGKRAIEVGLSWVLGYIACIIVKSTINIG